MLTVSSVFGALAFGTHERAEFGRYPSEEKTEFRKQWRGLRWGLHGMALFFPMLGGWAAIEWVSARSWGRRYIFLKRFLPHQDVVDIHTYIQARCSGSRPNLRSAYSDRGSRGAPR